MIESVIFTAIQDIVFFALFVGIAIFFGFAFFRIYKGQPVFMKRASMATEKGIYKAMGVSPREEMTAKKYAFSVLLFSLFGLILMMAILMGQAFLFMNPEQIGGMSWHLAFNTAASFITNTNWQAYSGETQASYLSQMLCMTVQNFLSGAVGIAVFLGGSHAYNALYAARMFYRRAGARFPRRAPDDEGRGHLCVFGRGNFKTLSGTRGGTDHH